jgi:two-component system, NarL family, nitrate/nitrite response regulator NarL
MDSLRAFVADDHPLYRGAVLGAIESCDAVELAGSAEDGEEALREILRLRPDVAVIDVQMPGLSGPGVVEALLDEDVPTRVLLMSGLATSEMAQRALAAGADGFIDKQATAEELCAALWAVARGERVVSPRLVEINGSLSGREHEVLRLVADGLSAPQIAERLVLSNHTVKTHMRNLYEKLGVTDRAEAVAVGMRRGLLD